MSITLTLYQTDDKGRRVLSHATVDRVAEDALTADDIIFSPFGMGYLSGVMTTAASDMVGESEFTAALNALVSRFPSAHYAYTRSLVAFGYQLARDDNGERP